MAETLVVVVSYKNFAHTRNTLFALMKQTTPVDIIVWDNNSPDGSGEQLADIFYHMQGIRVIRSEKNLLWGPAINHVFATYREPQHKFLGFMNNDITLPTTAVERMLTTLHQPNVGLVGPMGCRIGGPQDWAANRGEESPAHNENLPAKRATYVIGACVFLPASVWDEIGPMDDAMPLGADDHDYSIRVKQAGYEIWINQNVYADHIGHASGDAPEWKVWNQRGWEAFNEKWSMYYSTTDEAVMCHWSGAYTEGWDVGTGWLTPEQRELEYAKR